VRKISSLEAFLRRDKRYRRDLVLKLFAEKKETKEINGRDVSKESSDGILILFFATCVSVRIDIGGFTVARLDERVYWSTKCVLGRSWQRYENLWMNHSNRRESQDLSKTFPSFRIGWSSEWKRIFGVHFEGVGHPFMRLRDPVIPKELDFEKNIEHATPRSSWIGRCLSDLSGSICR
jgi:hypothetical protein